MFGQPNHSPLSIAHSLTLCKYGQGRLFLNHEVFSVLEPIATDLTMKRQ